MPADPAAASYWDERYRGDGFRFGTAPNRFLVAERPRIPDGGRVLAVADGEGRNGVWLASQGLRVDAFDPSPVAVEKARRLAAEQGVALGLAVADVDSFPWPEDAYDAVAAIFVQFAAPPLRRRLLERIHRALVPGGLLLLTGYRVDQLAHGTGGPRDPAHLYTEAQLRDELGAFAVERLDEHDTWLEEGVGHFGMSALVDVVARRPGPAGRLAAPPS